MARRNLHKWMQQRAWGCLGGALIAALAGLVLFHFPLGRKLADLSYDLPFLCRSRLATPEMVIVYLDPTSRAKFLLPSGLVDRRRHVELVERLTAEGARLIFYDIVFQAEIPEVDRDFAAAIRKHGNVVLGEFHSLTVRESQTGAHAYVREAVRPNPALREAAKYSGLVMVHYPDAGLAIRQILTGDAGQDAAVWLAARALGDNQGLTNQFEERWMNYYGSSPAFPSISFAAVLDPEGVPRDFFRNKAVFVGYHPDNMANVQGGEKFATPWTHFGDVSAPGVELLATSAGNLIQGNWLRRLPPGTQTALILVFGLFIGAGLALLRPWTAVLVTIASCAVVAVTALWLQYEKHLWWSWMIPVAVQAPGALVWSIGYQYAVASRRERQMHQAFSSYLSPHLVNRIAASDFDLSLGGQEVDATVLFTDLEGFTSMAESLPPQEVARILTDYFAQITTHILKHEGTIIKYVGDSVMAVWGAPLPDARQAERAVMAAQGICRSSPGAVAGRPLRTRIGINSGKGLAGNLGSPFRFDYTVIGATTNLANRLEALNKRLQTDILISEATRRQLPSHCITRYLGRFVLRGTTQPTAVYEVLEQQPPHAATFEQAIQACGSGDIAAAKALFAQMPDDGPARFYLDYLGARQTVPTPFVLQDSV